MTDALQRPQLMGILNITPDSFSDGGRYSDTDRAVEHALEMVEQGADIIDIGGESTRPGAERVSAAMQKQRVLPVIEKLRGSLPPHVQISIDTTLTEVADAAVDAGASIINDITAGRDDSAMFSLAAEKHTPLILVHMLGMPRTMQVNPVYRDVVAEIGSFLADRADAAMAAGVQQERIIIDPGFGFGKSFEHNLQIMANLRYFTGSGYKVILGASRKTFLRLLAGHEDAGGIIGASCAATVLGVMAGVSIVRVHDVRENRHAIDVVCGIANAAGSAALPGT